MTTRCAQHPERAALAVCGVCSRPLCESCRVEVVATEQVFCSERCASEARGARPEPRAADNQVLRAGLKKPIRTGWALWARVARRVAMATLPVAVVAGAVWWYSARWLEVPDDSADVPLLIFAAAFVLVLAYGMALVGIIVSHEHTGVPGASPHARAARRLVPWIATWCLVIAITLVGYLALILPGVYLAIRLFWADEFALVHDAGPFAALKESWRLTRKAAGPVFVFQFIVGLAAYAIVLPALLLLMLAGAGLTALGWTSVGRFSLAEAFLFCFIGLVAYGAMHAPEIVQFYGMRAARASLGPDELGRGDWLDREKRRPL